MLKEMQNLKMSKKKKKTLKLFVSFSGQVRSGQFNENICFHKQKYLPW